MLNGNDVERVENERPDFVRLSQIDTISGNKILLGIEHFRVDHLSKQNTKKPDKIQANNMVNEKKLIHFFETEKGKTDSKLSAEDIFKSLLNIATSQVGRQLEAQYNDYIASFEYSISNHISNASVYRENLVKVAEKNNYEIKLAFLIEIHSDFKRLFFNDDNGSRFCEKPNQFIFFDEVVRLLEKIDCNKVDYIILCFGDVIYSTPQKVLAIKAGHIREQLNKKGIKIYKYFGEDYNIAPYSHIIDNVVFKPIYFTDSAGNKKCRLSQSSEKMQKEDLKYFIENACYHALLAKNNNENFITTIRVQYVLDVQCPFITGWSINSKGLYSPIKKELSIQEQEKKKMLCKDFKKKAHM